MALLLVLLLSKLVRREAKATMAVTRDQTLHISYLNRLSPSHLQFLIVECRCLQELWLIRRLDASENLRIDLLVDLRQVLNVNTDL